MSHLLTFAVDPAVFDRFPGMAIVVAVAEGFDNVAERSAIDAAWRAAWEAAGREGARYGNAQSHPRVAPWRERFRAMGVSGKEFPSSVEAVLRRALKGGEPFCINPLVDFYNAVGLRHTVPAGAFDLDGMTPAPDGGRRLDLRLTRPGDRFTALDAATEPPLALPAGEIGYCDGPVVLTRHFVWRQSREALVSAETRRAVLLAEVPVEAGPDTADTVLAEFVEGMRRHFGVEAHGALACAGVPDHRL